MHVWQKVLNLPCFMKTPLKLINWYPPIFQTLSKTTTLACFFGWMCDHARSNVLLSLMIVWTETCRVLVPWCRQHLAVFYVTMHHIYWRFDTDDMLRFHITHTNTHRSKKSIETDLHISCIKKQQKHWDWPTCIMY